MTKFVKTKIILLALAIMSVAFVLACNSADANPVQEPDEPSPKDEYELIFSFQNFGMEDISIEECSTLLALNYGDDYDRVVCIEVEDGETGFAYMGTTTPLTVAEAIEIIHINRPNE